MAGTVHHAKFDRLFDILDVTGDGYLTQEDFDAIVHQVVSAPHGSPEGPRAQALRDAATRFWTGIGEHAEVDEVGRVSREAFRAALDEAFLRVGRFDELLDPAAEAWFALYDTDEDGRVSHREYELFHQSLGRPAAGVDAGFRTIDVDGDGYLTLDEFRAIVHQYYTSDDPDAPGNWLFGAI